MSDLEKAMKDAALHGVGFMKDGKHIAPHDVRGQQIEEIADKLAEEPPPPSLPEMTVSAIMRHHTFIHELGDADRWRHVIDLVYEDRIRMMQKHPWAMPTAVMIDREERRNCIAWLRTVDSYQTVYQHGAACPEPGGDDRLFGMPVFWAAPGSMAGVTVRVLTDFSRGA